MKTFLAAITLLLVSSLHAQGITPFPKAHVQNVWVQSIWSDGHHNGFPGIARVGDFYYVTFRSGEAHDSPTAKIVVIRAPAKALRIVVPASAGPETPQAKQSSIKAPLGPWKAFATDAWNFGGPALHQTKGGGILLAARALPEKSTIGFPSVCKVWTVTATGVEKPWIIPSAGDGAYQSFADGVGNDEVLLAYYSSHEYPQPKGVGRNPANIYLAHLRIRHTAP